MTRAFVQRETLTLRDLPQRLLNVRFPALLAAGELGNRPYLVTKPLPADVRNAGPSRPLTPDEFAGIAEVYRHGAVSSTMQFRQLESRVEKMHPGSAPSSIIDGLTRLTSALAASSVEIPIGRRWHGDLVPWNIARQPDGTPWVWDWEMCESDSVAGLDVVHWHTNSGIGASSVQLVDKLRLAHRKSPADCTRLGVRPQQMPTITALYALTFAERNAAYAIEHGSWERNRLSADSISELLNCGLSLLES